MFIDPSIWSILSNALNAMPSDTFTVPLLFGIVV
tara:strand:- start:188 stop:289 length:102 start_codon:yes stop_codon:yes gene_type:complete